jgi:hypothetical protein
MLEEWKLYSPDDLASWAEAQLSRVAFGKGEQANNGSHASLSRRSYLVDACAALARSLELSPDNPAVLPRFAYALAQLGLHYHAYACKCGGTIVPDTSKSSSVQGRIWERDTFKEAQNESSFTGLTERSEICFITSDKSFRRMMALTSDAVFIGNAYRDWGEVLYHHARQKNGLPAEVLYHEASTKFENSLDHLPDTMVSILVVFKLEVVALV